MDYCESVTYLESAARFGWKDKWKGWEKPTWVSEDGKRAVGVGVGVGVGSEVSSGSSEASGLSLGAALSSGVSLVVGVSWPQAARANTIIMASKSANIFFIVLSSIFILFEYICLVGYFGVKRI